MTYCKIGGVADVFCDARSEDDVMAAVECRVDAGLGAEDVLLLGGGANVLINDDRRYPLVLRLSEHFSDIRPGPLEGTARIETGIRTPRLVREAAKRGWRGFQFLAGIPGTLGGAIAMNAGIRELSTWDLVREVEGITWSGERLRLGREQLEPGYRRGNLPGDFIATVALCDVREGDREEIHRQGRGLSGTRRETQPLQFPSWGSTFRNPSGEASTGTTAGELIDRAGLKGYRVGDAQISEKHANFIVNRGAATASDALACIRRAFEDVRDRFDIRLEPEVCLIGFPPDDLEFLR
jgi:UDP-N-acetylmuramate dehydrogenase